MDAMVVVLLAAMVPSQPPIGGGLLRAAPPATMQFAGGYQDPPGRAPYKYNYRPAGRKISPPVHSANKSPLQNASASYGGYSGPKNYGGYGGPGYAPPVGPAPTVGPPPAPGCGCGAPPPEPCGCCGKHRGKMLCLRFGNPIRSSCDMPPHRDYYPVDHGYYYFRPYNYTMVEPQRQFVAGVGEDPSNPYGPGIFPQLYQEMNASRVLTPPRKPRKPKK